MDTSIEPLKQPPRRGITAVAIFLLWGAFMAFLAGITLVWRGTTLDRIWALNSRAYRELAPFGRTVGVVFLLLSAILLIASIGWFKRSILGWRLGVAIIATQLLGDSVNLFLGRIVEGIVGITIAGMLLLYMVRRRTRAAFGHCGSRSSY